MKLFLITQPPSVEVRYNFLTDHPYTPAPENEPGRDCTGVTSMTVLGRKLPATLPALTAFDVHEGYPIAVRQRVLTPKLGKDVQLEALDHSERTGRAWHELPAVERSAIVDAVKDMRKSKAPFTYKNALVLHSDELDPENAIVLADNGFLFDWEPFIERWQGRRALLPCRLTSLVIDLLTRDVDFTYDGGTQAMLSFRESVKLWYLGKDVVLKGASCTDATVRGMLCRGAQVASVAVTLTLNNDVAIPLTLSFGGEETKVAVGKPTFSLRRAQERREEQIEQADATGCEAPLNDALDMGLMLRLAAVALYDVLDAYPSDSEFDSAAHAQELLNETVPEDEVDDSIRGEGEGDEEDEDEAPRRPMSLPTFVRAQQGA